MPHHEQSMKKPYKLISHDRHTKKGVVASSLEELTAKARTLFGAGSDELKIVLEEDGTEIIEDDYLQMLENNTKLMVLKNIEQWVAPFLAYDETDTSQANRPLHNPVKILQKLHRSPGSIALLSEEELEVVISVAKSQVQNIGIPESEIDCLKDACERELDQKRRVRDALDQFNLYHKAVKPQNK